ncbi:hypothetical protein C8Q75DRAFT_732983 [Abortiporus biennis]|nr:hypothetical protein C8Q75DRAFT_732983 [Abortiporus biennis]
MSSFFKTIFGTWRNASPSTTHINVPSRQVDLEAQTITGTRVVIEPTSIPPPTPAFSHSPRTSDPIDDFFGVSHTSTSTRRSGTHDSRHDMMTPAPLIEEDMDSDMPPPPYADASDLPSYSAIAEPLTLAMYLFKFGFLFPLFWFFGIIILISPLQAPENWEPTKTEAEREELIELLRRTEGKWARRCLIAFCIFGIAALAVVVTAIMVMKST